MKTRFLVLLSCIALVGIGATTYTITQLTENVAPGAGTVIEVYDPTATPKSGKYSLANLATTANPTFTGTANFENIVITGTHAADALALPLAEGPVEMQIVGETTNMVSSPTTSMLYKVFTNAFTGTKTIVLSDSPALTGTGTTSGNLGPLLSVGDTTFVDMSKASQTNSVTGAITIAHATNGVHGTELTHVRWFFNPSGDTDYDLTIPISGDNRWRTNIYSAVPTKITNGTITKMYVTCAGPTGDATSQTNCYVSFEYFK